MTGWVRVPVTRGPGQGQGARVQRVSQLLFEGVVTAVLKSHSRPVRDSVVAAGSG